ncbi:MAG TPA: rhodanese-like domain-containing protein [Planctomycetota bacterium]|nr:rhodanese-like domain-containing protein [Planctomycetota bacterium]
MQSLRVTPEEAKSLADAGRAIFLDVRGPAAWQEATEQIPGSQRMTYDEVGSRVSDPGPEKEIIAYCT